MIKIKNLSKSFSNKSIFNNLNLDIPSNKLVFIVGKSGVGKSSLLKMIGGYESIDSGSIEFIDIENSNFQNIDFVFQDFNLVKGLTALENMQVGVNSLGLPFDKQKALNILKKINITNKEIYTKIENLSGGEQQRVAIARSILRNSQILLTDEPTGNLDFENSETIFQYLKAISKNKTVIVVTHDIDNAKKYGDFIVEIKKDKIDQYYLENQNYPVDTLYDINGETGIKNSKNKLKLTSKFLKIDLKKKFFQMIFLVFAFVATIIAFGTLMQFRTGVQTQTTTLKNSFLEADRAIVRNQNQNLGFSDTDIQKFQNLKNLKHLAKSYQYGGARLSYNNVFSRGVVDFSFIDYDQFYKDRMIDNISEGSFPTLDNEIILSKKIVTELNIIDPIGKSIFYTDESQQPKELRIAAINESIDITGKNFTFISNNFMKINNENLFQNNDFITLWTNSDINGVRVPIYHNKFSVFENGNFEIIENSNTIVDENYPKVWISKDIKAKSNLELNAKIRTDFFDKRLIFNLAGIIETEQSIVAVSQKDIDRFGKVVPTEILLYFDNNVDVNDFTKQLSQNPEFRNFLFSSNSANFIAEFSRSISTVLYVFEIAIGVLLAISVLFTLGFTKILNDVKRKEVGLLKSLGATLKQILTYHVSYFILINVFAFILSFALFVPTQIIFSSFLANSDQITINYHVGFQHLFIMWIVNFSVSTVIYSAFSYFKFRKNISYLIK